MTINNTSARVIVASLATAALLTACGTNSGTEDSHALALADQGSFAVGGTTTTAPGQFDPFRPAQPQGQTYRGDHAYAFYQVPDNARKLPLVMLHGAGQFSRTWETTPDGREGFHGNLHYLGEFTGSMGLARNDTTNGLRHEATVVTESRVAERCWSVDSTQALSRGLACGAALAPQRSGSVHVRLHELFGAYVVASSEQIQ